MNVISRTATAVVAALALSVPTAAITTTSAAGAAAGVRSAEAEAFATPRAAKPRIKLKRSKAYSHYGQEGVKVTATVTKGRKKARGKVTFSLNGTAVSTARLKRGQASYRLASTNAPGLYTVTATYRGKKRSVQVRVYDSALNLSAATFTISKTTPQYQMPDGPSGTVRFKDQVATTGYVDIYENGNVKGGSSSPDYCCMAKVEADGSFVFQTFLDNVWADKQPGTYTYQAFYTDGPEFADYIYSTPITVTVVP
ncbi:hypothetical protein GON03_10220 [Nocardioides sp. MAH-18]|uniref:Bacterial Ig-like domain-containing protein n=1 Tax=Nocardioides agri TaxID=2682843 RepID=A0A6L6XVG1_9ACTN|nr:MULTISPECIES: Ig-like domain-containing protein [unclassified Nocardioides]MBA2954699.1 Ig-like domain repeat protein [Nocardioides sp. CGMCC 1.13656]MVQ49555.1 hypothetical protein [Nocardioides sp. MAH-18]